MTITKSQAFLIKGLAARITVLAVKAIEIGRDDPKILGEVVHPALDRIRLNALTVGAWMDVRLAEDDPR